MYNVIATFSLFIAKASTTWRPVHRMTLLFKDNITTSPCLQVTLSTKWLASLIPKQTMQLRNFLIVPGCLFRAGCIDRHGLLPLFCLPDAEMTPTCLGHRSHQVTGWMFPKKTTHNVGPGSGHTKHDDARACQKSQCTYIGQLSCNRALRHPNNSTIVYNYVKHMHICVIQTYIYINNFIHSYKYNCIYTYIYIR